MQKKKNVNKECEQKMQKKISKQKCKKNCKQKMQTKKLQTKQILKIKKLLPGKLKEEMKIAMGWKKKAMALVQSGAVLPDDYNSERNPLILNDSHRM
jgi:hypothetical protein